MGTALGPLGGPVMRALAHVLLMTSLLGVANGQANIILMTLVLGVARDQPECLYGGTLGFGPWAHGMAVGLLGGPVMRAPLPVILMTLV